MSEFFTAFFRIIFAVILGTAAVLTTLVLSPVLLVMWVWKNLNNAPPRR
ncbi:hypothetical protein [Dyadobacter sp. 50-39]|nr:hypothetical protein [Dyadobacter sp. 50-39]